MKPSPAYRGTTKRKARPEDTTAPAAKRQFDPQLAASFISHFREKKAQGKASKSHSINAEGPGEGAEFTQARRRERIKAWLERRDAMTPDTRLKDDGNILLRRLESAPRAKVLLQQTPLSYNGGARCQAGTGCAVMRRLEADEDLDAEKISDNYRIIIDEMGIEVQYYHVDCFGMMVDLKSLVLDRFSLDLSPYKGNLNALPLWGLMFRKWFQHKGGVNLAKLSEYIDADRAFASRYADDYQAWYDNHVSKKCEERFGFNEGCDCPAQPLPPAENERPVLRDYVTAPAEGCNLLDILQHHHCELMKNRWEVWREGSGVQVKMEVPEKEANECQDVAIDGVGIS